MHDTHSLFKDPRWTLTAGCRIASTGRKCFEYGTYRVTVLCSHNSTALRMLRVISVSIKILSKCSWRVRVSVAAFVSVLQKCYSSLPTGCSTVLPVWRFSRRSAVFGNGADKSCDKGEELMHGRATELLLGWCSLQLRQISWWWIMQGQPSKFPVRYRSKSN